jgi:hypothetical protein
MNPAFREMFEGLRDMADALIAANTALKKTAEAAVRAQEEHDDVRDTVHRLEDLVMELLRRQDGQT